MSVVEAKAQLRRELRARVDKMPAAERATNAALVCQRVVAQEFWKSARSVLLFAPRSDEVNIWPLLEQALAEGKILGLPRYRQATQSYVAAQVMDLETDLVSAAYGIREPAPRCGTLPLAEIELALVPGIGFDPHGNRLGRGRGFYDRLLERFAGIKCGVAWDEQIVERIPLDERDVPMDVILTAIDL